MTFPGWLFLSKNKQTGRTCCAASGGCGEGGYGWWSRWGRACRCHSRLLCPCLLQLLWTATRASDSLMTPADLQWREARVSAVAWGGGWEMSGVRSRTDTEVVLDWQQPGPSATLKYLCAGAKKSKRVASGYFWAYACRCAINNGWAQRWECGWGNRTRHPCQPRKTKH